MNGNDKTHAAVFRDAAGKSLVISLSLAAGEPYCAALQFKGDAYDIADSVVAEACRMLDQIVKRHVRMKAMITKRIILPRSVIDGKN